MDSYRIFIVEDDAVIARVVRTHLASWGYTVQCAEDFDNVLGEFTAFAPQLVLLDISLPFFNGYHWCAEIRRVSNVPIIFLSSASDNMNLITAMNMGGDDFLSKPFELPFSPLNTRHCSAGLMTSVPQCSCCSAAAPC